MDFTKSQFVSYILALSGTCGFIWFLFSKAEDTINSKTKKSICGWLKNINPEEVVHNWPTQFADVFDRIFGEKHLSWKCFTRSCLASIISVIGMTLIWATIQRAEFSSYYHSLGLLVFVILHLCMAGLLNFFPDYISLLETRLVIKWMSKTNSVVLTLVLILVDTILTVVIFLISTSCIMIALVIFSNFKITEIWELAQLAITTDLPNMILLRADTSLKTSLGIFFYSTFFTSVWLWIYAISGFIVKLAEKLNISLTWFKGHLDINQKPLRSMALVSIMIVTIIFVVVPFLR